MDKAKMGIGVTTYFAIVIVQAILRKESALLDTLFTQ
jgi:hypothetical protein